MTRPRGTTEIRKNARESRVRILMVSPPIGLRVAPPLVVCNEEHRFLVLEQLREAGHPQAHLLLEPMGRNTAPAVTLAALQAKETDGDAILDLQKPVDHSLEGSSAWLRRTRELAEPAPAANKAAS